MDDILRKNILRGPSVAIANKTAAEQKILQKSTTNCGFLLHFMGNHAILRTMEPDILMLIRDNEEKLSNSERIVKSFIEKCPEQCALLTLSQFAENSGVSEATVIRFARKIGLSGFSELNMILKERIRKTFSLSSRFIQAARTNADGKQMVGSFVNLQYDYIRSVSDTVSSRDFADFCDMIDKACRIYLFEDGGASASPGNTLEFWLVRFGLEVKRISALGHRIFDLIVHHSDGDIFLGFCFGRSNADLTKLLTYCRSERIPALLITDNQNGEDEKLADKTLFLERGPLDLFHSMSVPVLLAECISLYVARHRGKVSGDNLKKLDDLRSRYEI